MEHKELTESLTTLRDYIRWGSSEFYRHNLTFGHGFSRALDESVYLVLHALALPFDWPESYFDTRLTETEREKVLNLLMKRIYSRKPSAYLTNEAWFCGLPFYVDERVLVPRSPIAELINNHFEPWLDATRVDNILDLCTGSGCIAIACQYAFPAAQVSASDLSADAIEVATRNRQKHGFEQTLSLYESDLFEKIPTRKFDLIVSNPPYVDAQDMADLTDEFKAEPEMGLAAGDDGLEIVDRMLSNAADYLTDHGLLVVEVGNSQMAMMEKYQHLPLSWIEFENGGSGVFCITAQDLKRNSNRV
ncbi:MAG: 50S ribosomal protein L3 N(5)-glutamine methyltransferase [Gammaproteobacteria bacterium]|nr:50S ribosomal protein L3 N(5)-glutamine methyltransferase [Gammaproteobacteria bacterium]MBT3725641.1 50S ribosomal protein L3 N(5)-glutamine methyltransferase [Gammaproteobacteria bacterium]MBT4078386.1 50S ribosomal protein L3 N(5)-glutamine methyltransferase [Gammaproteobacteria bacterium]MBT4195668.1 50S ribosomal protein L3 N(5)-glutamine methyltransferase [Gammaproteobacteria bacterium]MBT4449192.1 50S ribosomal protein L3 N(5)-glutamine methyltransferase [Gammaproteobacteria bacterium